MERTVFYSWQSDLPGNTNRSFIQDALERAVKAIREDASIEEAPRVDHDTAGVPGSPEIANTIFEKIKGADVFVCDVSIINQGAGPRPIPNPNVLIEFGYAMHALGLERIIMILNTTFGGPEDLPFDLRTKRQLTYQLASGQEKAAARENLVRQLERALRAIFVESDRQSITPLAPSLSEQVRSAIENAAPNQVVLTLRYMEWLTNEIISRAPLYNDSVAPDETLLQAIEDSTSFIIDFTSTVRVIAEHNTRDVALALYQGLAPLINKYSLPRGFSGSYYDRDFDYYKFFGHELCVILFAFLIQHNHWPIIEHLLDESFYLENRNDGQPGLVSFDYLSQYIHLFNYRNQRLAARKMCFHGDFINEQLTKGALAGVVPTDLFTAADLFLYLRSELQEPVQNSDHIWIPWTFLYMSQPPRYLVEATRKRYVERLLGPLGVDTVETLRSRLIERTPRLNKLFGDYPLRVGPLNHLDVNAIGSR